MRVLCTVPLLPTCHCAVNLHLTPCVCRLSLLCCRVVVSWDLAAPALVEGRPPVRCLIAWVMCVLVCRMSLLKLWWVMILMGVTSSPARQPAQPPSRQNRSRAVSAVAARRMMRSRRGRRCCNICCARARGSWRQQRCGPTQSSSSRWPKNLWPRSRLFVCAVDRSCACCCLVLSL